jgi:preprotein translocase subunit SecF
MKNSKPFDFHFMENRKFPAIISTILIVISISSLVFRGLDFGIDFTGGVAVEVEYDQPVDLDKMVRPVLAQAGFNKISIQSLDSANNVLIRTSPKEGVDDATLSDKIFQSLGAAYDGTIKLRKVDFVGPQVGKELTESGVLALLYALIGILIYVAFRFEYRFALGSIAALVHDILITMGFFSVFQVGFDLTVLAALLAVIGYSLNDTIVVFDRIRENFRMMRKGSSEEVINQSLNQTLSRTLTTSMTTLVVLISLFFLGGDVMHGFSLALMVGVVIGTYSSIYVASSVTLAMGISKADLMPPEKEGADLEEEQL